MIVLSCFDGMSCGRIALKELGIPVEKYYASEIDRFAIHNTQFNFPDTVQLGDVTKWREWDIPWEKIDLLLAGSPCQDVSMAGRMEGLKDGTRSNLFFTWVDILRHVQTLNPDVKFLLENVKMKKEFLRHFNETLGLYPVLINSALVSAQNRSRYYWTNIRTRREGLFGELHTDIPQPKDKGLLLKDILDKDVPEKYYLKDEVLKNLLDDNERFERNGNTGYKRIFHEGEAKMGTVTVKGKFQLDLIKERVSGINVTESGLRPYKDDKRKSGVSEYGVIACEDTKSPTVTASWPPCSVNGCLKDFKPSHEGYQVKGVENKANVLKAHGGGIEAGVGCVAVLTAKRTEEAKSNRREYENGHLKESWKDRSKMEPRTDGKTNLLTTVQKDNLLLSGYRVRRLTPHECCKLQTVPDWYKWDVSETQRYKMLGNGWTVDVIKHILNYMKDRTTKLTTI